MKENTIPAPEDESLIDNPVELVQTPEMPSVNRKISEDVEALLKQLRAPNNAEIPCSSGDEKLVRATVPDQKTNSFLTENFIDRLFSAFDDGMTSYEDGNIRRFAPFCTANIPPSIKLKCADLEIGFAGIEGARQDEDELTTAKATLESTGIKAYLNNKDFKEFREKIVNK